MFFKEPVRVLKNICMTVEKGDYLNIDVTLEGTPGGTDVRWGLDLVFAVGQINNANIASCALELHIKGQDLAGHIVETEINR